MSWAYEALFNRMDTGDGAGEPKQLDMWTEIPTSAKVGRMTYKTKTTWAGERLEAEVYPSFGRHDSARARSAIKSLTKEAQQRCNDRRAERRLILLAETNFTENDYYLTLTYQNPPATEKRAIQDLNNYFNRVRRIRDKANLPPLKYIYAMGGGEEDDEKQLHFHVLMNGGLDRDELEKCWKKTKGVDGSKAGGITNAKRIQMDSEEGIKDLLKYFFKQHRDRKREPGEHLRRWTPSKNLKQPKVTVSESRCSKARVKRIAHDIRNEAKAEMEAIYPGYRFIDCEVRYSDIIDGVYIRCIMRKNQGGGRR